MLKDDSIVVASSNQFACDLKEELLILNTTLGFYYGLDPVGKRIWSLLQEPKQVSAIRDVLIREYDVERECCTLDLRALLQDLVQNGLIEVKSAPTA